MDVCLHISVLPAAAAASKQYRYSYGLTFTKYLFSFLTLMTREE
jgi:hypothetical protein